jgi:hypothetical protein
MNHSNKIRLNLTKRIQTINIKRIVLFIFLGFVCISTSYCKKTYVEPITAAGDWTLIDAQLYIKRWGNYPLLRYDMFTATQKYNCLDLNGNDIRLDQIYKDSTRWTLTEDGGFFLDSLKQYEEQSKPTFIRLYPTEDGSARVFELDDLSDNYVRWKSSNREQALMFNGVYDNHTYYTKLTFRRRGTNTGIDMRPDLETSTYKGVIPSRVIRANVLSGHTWVIYKYKKQGFNSYQNISDTLYFITNRVYRLNTTPANQDLNYGLYDMGGYYTLDINHTRFGSNISCANIPKTAMNLGDIQNAEFKDNTIGTNGGYYYLFMKKIN